MNYTFSAIIPCFNTGSFLVRAIDSCLYQSFPFLDIVIIDDGSSDNSQEIIRSYISSYDNIQSLSQDNFGPAAARNSGVRIAKGDYLFFLDADDQLCSDAVEIFSSAMSTCHISPDFLFAGHYSVGLTQKVKKRCPPTRSIHPKKDFKRLILGKGISPTHSAIVINKHCFHLLSYPESIQNNEDFVLFAHLFAIYSGYSISHPVAYKYKRQGSLRSNQEAIFDSLSKAPYLLFDQSILPSEYMKFKPLYQSKRYLEVSRLYFKNREFYKFRQAFKEAIMNHPFLIFKFWYLLRYIRSFFVINAG